MSGRMHCSFCGRSDAEVRKLVAGFAGGYICDACASEAVRIMTGPAKQTFWMRAVARVRRIVAGASREWAPRARVQRA